MNLVIFAFNVKQGTASKGHTLVYEFDIGVFKILNVDVIQSLDVGVSVFLKCRVV